MAGGDIEDVPAHVYRKLELRLADVIAIRDQYMTENRALQNMFGVGMGAGEVVSADPARRHDAGTGRVAPVAAEGIPTVKEVPN